jgi:hypothetical protein
MTMLAAVPVRSEASRTLRELVERRREVARQLDDLDRAQREAGQAKEAAAAEVRAHARDRALGQEVAPEQVKGAETRLRKATAEADRPWAEQRAGIRLAVRRADDAIGEHLQQHLTELAREVEEADSHAAAARVDEKVRELDDAIIERERVGSMLTALVAASSRVMRPGDIAPTRTEGLFRELRRFHGEQAPVLTVDLAPRTEAAVAP